MADNSSSKESFGRFSRENAQAKRLVSELRSISGAKKLGNIAYKTAKKDMAKRKQNP